MTSAGNELILITDTSVLINFININRLDLLGLYQGTFFITEHVISEITIDFPEQQQILNNAIQAEILKVINVDRPNELNLYNELIKSGRLGSGECSAIACAIERNYSLAMEDKNACKQASIIMPEIKILKTHDIMVSLIIQGLIGLHEADQIKDEWDKKHRFKLKFNSFKEMIEASSNSF